MSLDALFQLGIVSVFLNTTQTEEHRFPHARAARTRMCLAGTPPACAGLPYPRADQQSGRMPG